MVVVRDLQLLGVNGVEAVLLLSCALLQGSCAVPVLGLVDPD